MCVCAHCTGGDIVFTFCRLSAPPPAIWLVWQTLTLRQRCICSASRTTASSVRRRQLRRSSPDPLTSTSYSGLNLGSPRTTHTTVMSDCRGEMRAAGPVCETGGSSSSRLCAAVWGWASWDCWYWAEKRARGTIHQNGAVCTVGIDMNNPCFLYPSLCYHSSPITLCVAFFSNTQ